MIVNVLGRIGLALGLASVAYSALALWRVSRFQPRMPSKESISPGVTIMVPVYGATARLEECLRSCLNQDYPILQVVFGVHDEYDAGRHIVERIMRAFPDSDARLVIDSSRIGTNPKVCNLANMYTTARHDIIVMVDSDVIVGPDFLGSLLTSFDSPNVGAVTCLYKGLPQQNVASQLGALHINDWIIPSALVDHGMRKLDICFGAVMAVTRQALESIGGLPALANAVAEDDVLGELIHKAGYAVRINSRRTLAGKSCGAIQSAHLMVSELEYSGRACSSELWKYFMT